ncbi:MAG TPA: alpha/beta hydrolase [Burkholderiales bacterium]|nr:alpha/beta hydrolase [Burkholderiales bacterium]
MKEEVVLVPGLWMPAAIMAPLARRLARAGYRTRPFTYSGRQSLEAAMQRLADFARGGAPHFVGHSLGGVLIFDALERYRELAAARVVLIGAPVNGCLAGRRLGAWPVGRWMLGASTPRWENCAARWQRSEPLGVIAGTRAFGLGRTLGGLPGENDGVVQVEETTVQGMAERVLLSEGHSMLAVSRRVAALVEHFLRAARFA